MKKKINIRFFTVGTFFIVVTQLLVLWCLYKTIKTEGFRFRDYLLQGAPYLAVITILLMILCLGISYLMARQIVNPIEKMAECMDEIEKNVVYEELKPFAKKINSQNRMRAEFTANVSHELKTPLTSISGYAQLIESGIAKEGDIIDFAQKIDKESNRLLELINDIIKLSKLDEGSGSVSLEEVDLLDVAYSCANRLEINADKKNVAFSVQGDHVVIKAFRSMIEEMLYNLFDNGIRYNREGGYVKVSIYASNGKGIVVVKDNGIGVAIKHQVHIFERFYRVDKSHSKATGGTGLGLSIVKNAAAYHKAKIEINSELNKGTEIKIIFNIADTPDV